MAVIRTISATPLARVTIETSPGGGAHMWLRKGTKQTTDPDSGQDVYEADEIYYYTPDTPTLAEAEASFDQLWAQHELDGVPEVEQLRTRLQETETAIVELADLLGGE